MATIAIFGLNGLLGKPVVDALLSEQFISKIKTPIRLVTHSDKKPFDSDKVEYYSLNDTTFKKAFEGADVVINLGNIPASPIQDILDAVIANKVKLYIPSQFGVDVNAVQASFPGLLDIKIQHSKSARDAGIKTVDFFNGYFIDDKQLFFGHGVPLASFNFNKDKNEVEVVGDEKTLINPSFFVDIGNSLAAIATSDDFSKFPDSVHIYSDKVTIGDIILHYEKQHGVKLNKVYTKKEDLYKESQEKFKNFSFADFSYYLKVILSQGEGKGVIWETSNERDLINPNESLFKWTKYIV